MESIKPLHEQIRDGHLIDFLKRQPVYDEVFDFSDYDYNRLCTDRMTAKQRSYIYALDFNGNQKQVIRVLTDLGFKKKLNYDELCQLGIYTNQNRTYDIGKK